MSQPDRKTEEFSLLPDFVKRAACVVDAYSLSYTILLELDLVNAVINSASINLSSTKKNSGAWKKLAFPQFPSWVRFHEPSIRDFIKENAVILRKHLEASDAIALSQIKSLEHPLFPLFVAAEPYAKDNYVDSFHDPVTSRNFVLEETNFIEEDYSPVFGILCYSASVANVPRKHNRQFRSWRYYPGAGDDEENWAKGLSFEKYIYYRENIINLCHTDEAQMENFVENISARIDQSIDIQFTFLNTTMQFSDKDGDIELSSKSFLKGSRKFWVQTGLDSVIHTFLTKSKKNISPTVRFMLKDTDELDMDVYQIFQSWAIIFFTILLIKDHLQKPEASLLGKDTIKVYFAKVRNTFKQELTVPRWMYKLLHEHFLHRR
eukprot:snap_masked-scaffold_12-processed-gene-12.57-mRNA-1 protein AED:1.00 eAED:1.00 QI:0/0/0/0/1/1/3/0/376